ncbi:hypothetical protein [Oceanicoccus sagamiensis]|uniref:Glycosyltransferase RgtA/B/C/D-like domain-containing protein n=1 Tax=Oceanicoccus sagamiensis TaxID=716816 RepID=A0A1X9NBQ5_9GAMM|nr:hypothetical protein [Oceanicoccus sagamiensis]ARN73872.1 hypothetical protein BST96_06945 [Oceanicoccus sagamiensis]
MTKNMSQRQSLNQYSALLAISFYGVFFGLCCLLIDRMAHGTTTIALHTKYAIELAEGTKNLPHGAYFYSLWFFKSISGLSWQASTTVLISFLATLNAIVVHYIFSKLLPNFSTIKILAMTFVAMTVAAIYIPFFHESVFFGQGSPNVWHNSTVIAVKAISVLIFYMLIEFLEKEDQNLSWKPAVTIAALMTLSVLVKPTLMIVLLPAIALHLVVMHRKNFTLYWKATLIVLIPILLMLYQFSSLNTDVGSKGARVQKIELLTVWRMFTPNVAISILITLAFPLAILVFRFRNVVQDRFLSVAWFAMLAGMLQFSLLAEYKLNGDIITSANWIGGYLIGLTLVFVFSIAEFARWLEQAETASQSRVIDIKIWITSILLALHTYSGFYYIYDLLIDRKTDVIWQ